jgi:MinD-like ATPase involved in chromosome partitioning or flagellar assembly
LNTHQQLFDQIGGRLLSDLQPTRARIGVCSTFPREGKTTIATCLARWAALSGKRTLLIDADIERPKMTVMCGLDCTFGWQSILDADIPASETMIRSIESGLVFMPSRAGAVPVITDKAIDRMSMITFQMKYEFDVVVIDMGTIDNICAHGTQGMDIVDAMLVTRDPSRTSVGQMMDTRRVLKNIGIGTTYVAQNFARQDVA